MNSWLRITDGTLEGTIDFLDENLGFLLNEWKPAIVPLKGGGVWQSSPLMDGRRLAMRNFDNAIETFDMKLQGGVSQDTAIIFLQKLTTLLEKAIAYWTTNWQYEPVWIEARGATETNIRYAVIRGYTLEGLNNPYAQPFFGACDSVIDNFSIILERDHWLDHEPETQHCVEADTMQDVIDSVNSVEVSFPVGDTDDDAFVTRSIIDNQIISYDSSSGTLMVGIDLELVVIEHTMECGMRFPNVTIPHGMSIVDAWIDVVSKGAPGDQPYALSTKIFGEKVDNATAFTAENFDSKISNPTTAITYTLFMEHTWETTGDTHRIGALQSIIQEIVNRDGWVSGNSLCILMNLLTLPDSDSCMKFAGIEDLDYAEPVLHIKYHSGIRSVGIGPTCTEGTYVANKHSLAQITEIFRWSADDGYADVYSDRFLMFPTVEVGDRIYFIVNDETDLGPFDSLVFNLEVVGSPDRTLDWHYSKGGGAYDHFPGMEQGDINLTEVGESIYYFEQPDDLAMNTVNGVTGYIVMAEVTAAGTGALPAQLVDDFAVYCINVPYLNIDSLQIPGELSALARIRALAYNAYVAGASNFVGVGIRSISRGADFNAYINFSDRQNPFGITINDTFLVADTTAPSGFCIEHTTPAATDVFQSLFDLHFDNNISTQYRGTYHAYIRCKQTGGALRDIGLRLQIYPSIGSAPYYSSEGYTDGILSSGINLVDLGIVSLGNSQSITLDDAVQNSSIDIQYIHLNDASIVMKYYDLILLPVDEWAGIYIAPHDATTILESGHCLDMDATGSMRAQRALLRQTNSPDLPSPSSGLVITHGQRILGQPYSQPINPGLGYFVSEWTRQARGGPILQANANQRIWFMFASNAYVTGNGYRSYFDSPHKVRVYRNSRYLTMRGAI